MRWHIETPDELIEALAQEQKRAERDIKEATTQKQVAYLRGRLAGLTEAVFYVGEHIKTLEDRARAS